MMNVRLTYLAIALATASTASFAQDFSQTIFFGDSLTDTGQLKDIVTQVSPAVGNTLQPSFTTNPDPVWSSHLAQSYGTTAQANTNTNPTGTNYAVGGARSGSEVTWNNVFIIPTTQTQITSYLTQTGGKTDPNALYTVWIGSNDLIAAAQAPSIADAQTAIQQSVIATATNIETLHRAGATTILVPNIPDISLTPRVLATNSLALQESAQLAARLYNANLFSALNQSNANVVPANTYALLQEATNQAAAFGFSNTSSVACNMPNRTNTDTDPASTSLACTPNNLVEAGANESYVFADDIHPAGRTHRILSQYYRSILDAPKQFAQLNQNILFAHTRQQQQLNHRINQLQPQHNQWWIEADTGYQQVEYQKIDRLKPSIKLGGDIVKENHHVGLFSHYQQQAYQLNQKNTAQVETIGLGIYHRYQDQNYRFNLHLGADHLKLETTRHIDWDGAARSHQANTTGHRLYAGLQGGYLIEQGKFTYQPYVGVTAQTLSINDLMENQATLSTAMKFHKQTLNSLQGELGIHVDYQLNQRSNVQATVGYVREFENQPQYITASLTSIPQYNKGFTTAMQSSQPTDYARMSLGLQHQLNQRLKLNAALHTQLGEHKSQQTHATIGLTGQF